MTNATTLDLFDAPSVRIQRVLSADARRSTDSIKLLCDRLSSHQAFYPAIDRWIKHKVVPDLKTGRRMGYIGYVGETPALVAVLKLGSNTKFCHVSVEDGFQGGRLGHLIFSIMASEVRNRAQEIHFTLPRNLWDRERGFFCAFGFEVAERSHTQYRLFDDELRCSAPFAKVWSCVLAQLPTLLTSSAVAGFRVNDGVVLSIGESPARLIMQGRKTVEIRKRFHERWVGCAASVYATGQSRALLGNVTIKDVTKAHPAEIWDRFGLQIGCSKEEFDEYAGGKTVVYALHLVDPEPYEAPIPLSQLSHLLGETLYPPQSYATHSNKDVWGRALSVAAVLHGKREAKASEHAIEAP